MWLFVAPGTNHGHLRRCLALGRLAPETAVVLTGSQFNHGAPNCIVEPYSERRLVELRDAASVALFDTVPPTSRPTPLQRFVFIQRTGDWPIPEPQVDIVLTAGLYEETEWPGVVTEGWINPVETIQPAHDVVVIASGSETFLPWYEAATAELLYEGVDVVLVTPEISSNAVEWIASANVVISAAGSNTLYEALHHGKRFIGWPTITEQRTRLRLSTAAGEAVLEESRTNMLFSTLQRVRDLEPRVHPNGASVALETIG